MTSSPDTPAGSAPSLADRLAKLSPQQRELLLRSLGQRAVKDAPDAIPRATPGQALPLTPTQRQIWVFERLQPGTAAYLMYDHMRLDGRLDVPALQRACERLVQRHDALRMRCFEQGGEPMQMVVEDMAFAVPVVDLSGLPEDQRQPALQALIDAESARPLDLSRPPLIRMTIARLADDSHALLTIAHHIVCDAWSLGLLHRDLIECYNAFRAGREPALPEQTLRFADVVLWQREPSQQQRQARQVEFWRDALAGTSGLLDLPTDHPRGAVISARGARHTFALPSIDRGALADFARAEGSTLFMLLLSAFQALLARYSGDGDIVVGSPVANRRTLEMEGLVGLFVNTIAFRGDLSGDPSFRAFLARNRGHVLSALENGEAPLERVLDQLTIERAPGRSPLFQTMFVLQAGAGEASSLDGVTTDWFEPDVGMARFELTLSLMDDGQAITGLIDYGADLFDAGSIARMGQHYDALLRGMLDTPERPISQIPLTTVREREELIALGDGGPAHDGEGDTLHALFALQAARTPEAIALVEPAGGALREWTYAQALARANGIAGALHAQGIGREHIVAVLVDRSAESVLALLGVLAAGAAYLPLDPGNPDDRLRFLLEDAGARALLVPPQQTVRADALAQAAAAAGTTVPPVLATGEIAPSDAAVAVARDPRDAAYLIYTSGSTGTPKGVVVEHRGAVNLVRGFLARHRFEGQRLLMIPPLIFDASVGDVFPALACGSALVLHPAPTELGPSELERFCGQAGVTAIDAPAALWRRWSEGWALQSRTGPLLPALQLMMIGGESVPVEQVRRFAQITDRRVTLCNHYGPTEASVCATLLSTVDGEGIASLDLPIGRPLPGVRTYLLDAHLQPVPRGVVGELYIGGRGVARGYLGAQALTDERFLPDPFADSVGDRMYRTGDLARWSHCRDGDGLLQFIGRRDHQIKLRGVRIELGEIDNALAAVAGVQTAATLLREDRPGDRRLVAYVVADPDAAGLDAAALRLGLARRLPEAMLPSAYVFLAAMPLNANGKIDRRALPAPGADAPAERAIRAPATATETAVLAVWHAVLGREDLSTDDDFFASGGDSLSTLPLVFQLQSALGVEVPLSAVFATPTIVGLSATIDRILAGQADEALDLHAHATLPDAVDAARVAPPRAPRAVPASVLLTGATGFLGAYVLRDLLDLTAAEVVCLVRADTAADGLRRIRANLETYRLWREGDEARLVPVLGDLGSPRLGLDAAGFDALAHRVDAIIHNGGQVNFIAPYEHLEAANVGGTREVLVLATTGHLKPVQLVSTLGVYVTRKHLGRTVAEDHEPPDAEGQHGGYNQSKWVSERLGLIARERGVPVAIHRPARITGDRDHGISNTGDYFNAWIRGCVRLGMAPKVEGDFFDMTPVDYVARAVVAVLLGAGDANGNYHYFNARTLPVTEAVAAINDAGLPLQHVPYPRWQRALMAAVAAGDDNPLRPFAGLFPEIGDADAADPDQDTEREAMPVFDCSATEAAVAPLAGDCPPADRALFDRYLRFLLEVGALTVPADAATEGAAP